MSLQDNLRARRNGWFDGEEFIPVPGYGGELVARYARASWTEIRPFMLAVMDDRPGPKELEAAAKLIVAANTGLEAHVKGEVAEIKDDSGAPVKMGLGLARFLGLDMEGIDNDVQAVFEIFPSDVALMNHIGQLSSLQQAREAEADEAIAKN